MIATIIMKDLCLFCDDLKPFMDMQVCTHLVKRLRDGILRVEMVYQINVGPSRCTEMGGLNQY